MGARPAGMGYASSVVADETALFNNPGALGYTDKSASFFAFESRPSLPGASRMAAGASWVSKFGVAGFGIFRFGDDLYREQIASVGFGNKFGIASLGAKVNYIQYSAEAFGTKQALTLSFGGLAKITPQILAGAYIVNLNQASISPDERLPTKLVAGMGFILNEQFFITTEVEKDIDYKATWRSGAEYTIRKKVFVRTGFNLNPMAASFGLGTKSKQLKIDCALAFNKVLGPAYQTSATYQFERRTRK